MKVFVFDLLAYGEHLDHLKVGNELPYPLSSRHFKPDVAVRTYAEHLDAWEEIDRLGYDGLGFNEHHCSPYGLMNSPNLMAASAAQRTKRVRLLIYGNLLPLHEPLRLAEELAMLDCLSNGRLISGFARGIPREYQVHNVALSESRARFEEAYEIVTRAWTEDIFSYQGKFWSYQRRRAVAAPGAAAASADLDADRRQQGIDRVRREAQHPHHAGPGTRRAAGRHHPLLREMPGRERPRDHARPPVARPSVYVADSKAQAVKECGPYLLYFNRTLFSHGNFTETSLQRQSGYTSDASTDYVRPENLHAAQHAREDFRNMTMEDVARLAERLPWGTPQEVAQRIIALADHTGADTVQISFNRGAMPQEMFLEQIRRFARDVLPIVQAHRVTRVPAAEEVTAYRLTA